MPPSLIPVKTKNPMNAMASDPKSQDMLDRKLSPETAKVSPAKHYNDDTMQHALKLYAPTISYYNGHRTDTHDGIMRLLVSHAK